MLKKKHEVVMLPTNRASDKGIILITNSGRLAQADRALDGNKIFEVDNYGKEYDKIPQHLHFLSDEEIKERDWFYGVVNGTLSIYQYITALTVTSSNTGYSEILYDSWKKVIASTDKSLFIRPNTKSYESGFNYTPQIRTSFVKVFVDAYNSGNPIKWVDLEYEDVGEEDWMGDNYNGEPFWNERLRLKLRNDNTVITHAIKESFTREEIYDILHEYGSSNYPNPYYKGRRQAIIWFDENYYY